MSDIYYNYLYLDTRYPGDYLYNKLSLPFKPIYVGKGKSVRAYRHLYDSYNRNKMTYLCKTIRKIKNVTGEDPVIWFYDENISEELAFKNEKYLINLIGRRDLKKGYLLNLTDGGEGASGTIYSKEAKQKISQSLKGNTNGKHISKEAKIKRGIKISETRMGHKHSLETKKKLSNSHKGLLNGKANNKYIGTIVTPYGEFDSINSAKIYLYENKISVPNLRNKLIGKARNYGTIESGYYIRSVNKKNTLMIKKNLTENKGEIYHPKFRGYYYTPYGIFSSMLQATKNGNLSRYVLRKKFYNETDKDYYFIPKGEV